MINRTLLGVLAALLLVAPATATSPHYVETLNVTEYPGQQIIGFAQQFTLPPNPHNPSSMSPHYVEEFELHDSAHTQNGMYFAVESAGVPHGLGYLPGYEIDAAGTVGGTFMDPIVVGGVSASGFGFPGDTITTWWFGPGDPNAIAHGTPYIEMQNDNGSGMGAPGWTSGKIDVDYTGPYVDAVQDPYLDLKADPTWSPPFTNFERNCWGDLPASNQPSNISKTRFLDYYVTADHAVHFATFQTTGVYLDPIFVNFAGTSIPGCGLTVATPTLGGVTYSDVSTYGGS